MNMTRPYIFHDEDNPGVPTPVSSQEPGEGSVEIGKHSSIFLCVLVYLCFFIYAEYLRFYNCHCFTAYSVEHTLLKF